MAAATAAGAPLRQLLLPTIRRRLATGGQPPSIITAGTTMAQGHGSQRCVRSYMTDQAAKRQERTQLLTRTELALPLALVSLNAASLAIAYYGPHIPK